MLFMSSASEEYSKNLDHFKVVLKIKAFAAAYFSYSKVLFLVFKIKIRSVLRNHKETV